MNLEETIAHYQQALAHGEPELGWQEFAETKQPRHVLPFEKKLISKVNALRGFVPSAVPAFIEGCTAVLLGCGSGHDAFLLAAMVGPKGRVIALDPRPDDIAVAQSLLDEQMQALGYAVDLEFSVGVGESLALQNESVDVVVINTLFNAAPNKQALLQEALRVLKPGGELYLSSLFADNKRLSKLAQTDPALRRNYLAGSMYMADFRRLLVRLGLNTFRYMEKRKVKVASIRALSGKSVRKELKGVRFTYRVIRAFKLMDLEDSCENYKLNLTYEGNAPGCEQFFDLDDLHRFFTDDRVEVCGNTFAFIDETRFAKYFKREGDRTNHYGIYDYCRYCGGGQGDKPKAARKADNRDCDSCIKEACDGCAD